MGALKDWVKQDWVRIGTDGKIKGKCGTSKDKNIMVKPKKALLLRGVVVLLCLIDVRKQK